MKIGVVLVTFNRKQDLIKALESYRLQTKAPEFVLVVNNNSNDGTKEFLDEWQNKQGNYVKKVIHLNQNVGGSGGFYTGLQEGLKLNADWLWVADDDAFPEPNALENIEIGYNNLDQKDNVAALCGTVINNKKIDLNHRRILKQNLLTIDEIPIDEDKYFRDYFDIDLFSYVGSVINRKCLECCGLTEKDYFIFFDDTEHSLRLSKYGRIICIPSVHIVHDTLTSENSQISWKNYYGLRNQLYMYKSHFPSRYYNYLRFKLALKSLISKPGPYKELVKCVLQDASRNKQGLHEVYKPGWTSSDFNQHSI